MKTIKIALAGQPNVGKSMLINAIGDARQKVGNFAGVTVEKSTVHFERHGYAFEIIDLPGTYSLDGYSVEEKVARHYLVNEDYDVILNVLDSTHMQRNLKLSLQMMHLSQKTVLALNMSDEAEHEGIYIDAGLVSQLLGTTAVAVSAKTKQGVNALLDAIIQTYEAPRQASNIIYSESIEEEILDIESFLKEKNFHLSDYNERELAALILREDERVYTQMHDKPIMLELQPRLVKSLEHIYAHFDTKDMKEIEQIEYQSIARGIWAEAVSCKHPKKQKSMTQKVDDLLMHKFLGLPIFLGLMWGLFQLTFTLGAVPMDYIDAFFSLIGDEVRNNITNPLLRDLLSDGIIAGVGAVVMFLPNIIILYIGIALLETTGYMSRVAFLLDGFFHKFGLHGKSFIPLVTGFGCSVPAYMAARTLKSEKDRLITLFIIGFMSCGARLPIYVLFAGAFFTQENAGNILFFIYLSGALLGLVMAKLLRVLVFKGKDEPFIMEMPKYRLPSFKLLYHTVSNNAWLYLKKAGTFILAASILIWFASNYPKNELLEQSYAQKIERANDGDKHTLANELAMKQLESSYLGIIGHATEPFFAPLGYDWRLTVALETGLAAKEVVVATLGILYNIGDDVDETSGALLASLKANISLATAISFIVFVMIYLPCLAASLVFAREAGGFKYLAYLFIFTTATAWVFSFIAYRVTLLL